MQAHKLELRFVDAFIRAGVSGRTMRRAHARAQDKLGTTHPFCSNRIFTDGRTILLQQGEEDSDQILIDLATDQAEFSRLESSMEVREMLPGDSQCRF